MASVYLPPTSVYSPPITYSAPSSTLYLNQPGFKYFLPPPIIPTTYKYQDVNNDVKLQDMVTTKFINKTIKWLENDPNFLKCQKFLPKIKGKDGYDIIYRILKLYVKKTKTNWYDLSDQSNLVKDFIRHKLKH